MSACAAYGCTNRPSKKIPGITFHRFPKDENLKRRWILAIRREKWQPSEYSRLCSEHFTEDNICRSLQRVRLLDNAIPTIFEHSSSYYKTVEQVQPPRRKQALCSEEPSGKGKAANESANKKINLDKSNVQVQPPPRERTLCSEESSEERKAENKNANKTFNLGMSNEQVREINSLKLKYESKIRALNRRDLEQKKEIKSLKQKLVRKKRKIANLSNLLQEMKKKRFLKEDVRILGIAAVPNSESVPRQLPKTNSIKNIKTYSPTIICIH